MHVLAEQLENCFANRFYNPHCHDLKMEQWKLWRKIINEYKNLINDLQPPKHRGGSVWVPPLRIEPAKIATAFENEMHHHQVPHNNLLM